MVLRFVSILLLLASTAGGNTASLSGTVVNKRNEPIEGAQVYILPCPHPETMTKKDGTFLIESLEPGVYTVFITYSGYNPWAIRNIQIEAREKASLDATLVEAPDDSPVVTFWEPRQIDIDAYTPTLEAFQEPCFCSESLLKKKIESYRFLWMRTFNRPVFFQLTTTGAGNAALIYKELNGKGGYGLGVLAEKKVIDVLKRLGKGEQPEYMAQGAFDYTLELAKAGV
jgi:hypothetical protein